MMKRTITRTEIGKRKIERALDKYSSNLVETGKRDTDPKDS
jgi:hypothetical protein